MIYISRFCSIGSIVGVVILGACAFATNDAIGAMAYFLIAILLSIYVHNEIHNTATGETIITTTTPPWWDGVHEMD